MFDVLFSVLLVLCILRLLDEVTLFVLLFKHVACENAVCEQLVFY